MNPQKPRHPNFLRNLFKSRYNKSMQSTNMNTFQEQNSLLDYYISFAQNHPGIILVFSLDGDVITQNKNTLKDHLGYNPKKHFDFKEVVSEQTFSTLMSAFNKASNGQTERLVFDVINRIGEELHVIGTFIPIGMDDSIEGIVLILEDITIQKQLENNYQYIFNHLHVGIWMRESICGKFTFASEGLKDILQIPLATLYDDPDCWKNMILPIYRDEIIDKYNLLAEGESIEHKYRIQTNDGTIKWIHEQTIPRLNIAGEVTHLFGMVADITPEEEMRRKLEFMAKNDPLTALPNYHSLHEKLDHLTQTHATMRFALLYIDLDNFYWINDYLGHQIGDIVVKTIANRLVALIPENGYAAKMDGDTFVLIFPEYVDKVEVFQFADEIIHKIRKRIIAAEYEFYVTASIGISFYPDNGDSKLTLLENAHTALYHAKHLGKNNYQVYSFDRDIDSHKKYMLEQDLRKAIENEEFELYYQPQVQPKSGAINGAEALIRWNHKDWGVVSPAEFIPLAEEKHLIHHIGNWVIRTVCHQLKTWKDQGYTLYPIAINISPIRFLKPGFVETIKHEINTYQVNPKYIHIEITEGLLLRNEENVVKTLTGLKELGVRISLDDFGTGYSSFHYLQKFDLDILKIDQTFIRNLVADHKTETKEAAIISAFLHLAKGLHMKVVAEGVEEYEQLEFLKQKQCDLIQGYLFSKPVPVKEFEQLMETRYLKPKKKKKYIKPKEERRKYFRFVFPAHLRANMHITEVKNKKVNMGAATILVENISIGGIRFLSTLRLPVSSNIKLNFQFELMNVPFSINGILVYKNEEEPDIYSYGVSFKLTEGEHDKLAELINKMSVLRKVNSEIPDTDLIKEDPQVFLRKKLF